MDLRDRDHFIHPPSERTDQIGEQPELALEGRQCYHSSRTTSHRQRPKLDALAPDFRCGSADLPQFNIGLQAQYRPNWKTLLRLIHFRGSVSYAGGSVRGRHSVRAGDTLRDVLTLTRRFRILDREPEGRRRVSAIASRPYSCRKPPTASRTAAVRSSTICPARLCLTLRFT